MPILYRMRAYNWQKNFSLCTKYTIHALFKKRQSQKLGSRLFCSRLLQILGLEYHSQNRILAGKIKPSNSLYRF